MIKFVKLVKIEEVTKISNSEVYWQKQLGNGCKSPSTQVNTENIINQESVVFNTINYTRYQMIIYLLYLLHAVITGLKY